MNRWIEHSLGRRMRLALVLGIGCAGSARAGADGPEVPHGKITCTVSDASGKRLSIDVGVRRATSGAGQRVARADGRGVAIFDSLEFGAFVIAPTGRGIYGSLPPEQVKSVELSKDAPHVEIALIADYARVLSLRIPGRVQRRGADERWMLVHMLSGKEELLWCGEDPVGDTTDILNLPVDRSFDVLIRANSGTQCAYLEGVRPGGAPIDVMLSPGKSISGRIEPRHSSVRGRALHRGAVLGFDVKGDGTFRIDGLPSGLAFTVQAMGYWGGKEWSAGRQVQSGTEDVKLVLSGEG